ncbi:unnamed protein product [Cunninghamella echinulata]
MNLFNFGVCIGDIDNRNDLQYSRGEIIEGCSQQTPNILFYCNKEDPYNLLDAPCLWKDTPSSNLKQITCSENQKCQCQNDRATCV